MSKEILQIAEGLANERGLKKADIFDAIETALATATAKRYQMKMYLFVLTLIIKMALMKHFVVGLW